MALGGGGPEVAGLVTAGDLVHTPPVSRLSHQDLTSHTGRSGMFSQNWREELEVNHRDRLYVLARSLYVLAHWPLTTGQKHCGKAKGRGHGLSAQWAGLRSVCSQPGLAPSSKALENWKKPFSGSPPGEEVLSESRYYLAHSWVL